MILLLIFWSLPFILVLAVQYGVGEFFLIKKRKLYRAGYTFVVLMMLAEVAYGVYVFTFVDYMDFLGLGQLIFASYLFHRFTSRWSSLVHPGSGR
jgi:hypothetical protein